MLLTDTVGFIAKLPHQLVEAFHATLEETRRADLICHVLDASRSEEEQAAAIESVDSVLAEIGVDRTPRLLVLNKIDLLSSEELTELRIARPEGVPVSAVTGEGLAVLRAAMRDAVLAGMESLRLLFPHSEGAALAELYAVAGDLEREETPDGVIVTASVGEGEARRFDRYRVKPGASRSSRAPA